MPSNETPTGGIPAVGAVVCTTVSCSSGFCVCLPTSRRSVSPISVCTVVSWLTVGRSRSAGEIVAMTPAFSVSLLNAVFGVDAAKPNTTNEIPAEARTKARQNRGVKKPDLEDDLFFMGEVLFDSHRNSTAKRTHPERSLSAAGCSESRLTPAPSAVSVGFPRTTEVWAAMLRFAGEQPKHPRHRSVR